MGNTFATSIAGDTDPHIYKGESANIFFTEVLGAVIFQFRCCVVADRRTPAIFYWPI